MSARKILNPISGCKMNLGGPTHMRLVAEGTMTLEGELIGREPPPPAGKFKSPITGFFLDLGGQTHEKLVKEGILDWKGRLIALHQDDIVDAKEQVVDLDLDDWELDSLEHRDGFAFPVLGVDDVTTDQVVLRGAKVEATSYGVKASYCPAGNGLQRLGAASRLLAESDPELAGLDSSEMGYSSRNLRLKAARGEHVANIIGLVGCGIFDLVVRPRIATYQGKLYLGLEVVKGHQVGRCKPKKFKSVCTGWNEWSRVQVFSDDEE